MIIYDYHEEKPLEQGDIFFNIPFIINNFLINAEDVNRSETNEATKIYSMIMKQGRDLLIETFLSSSLCILGTHTCDIDNRDFLVFFPLEKFTNRRNLKKIIRDNKHLFYLPEIKNYKVSSESKTVGPFVVDLDTPITIPKSLIESSLLTNRLAGIKIQGKDLFSYKLSNLFVRPSFDESIFYNYDQIIGHIERIWKNNEAIAKKMRIISRIKWDLNELSSVELDFTIFKKPITLFQFDSLVSKLENIPVPLAQTIIDKSKILINENLPNPEALKIFYDIVDGLYSSEDCIFELVSNDDIWNNLIESVETKEENNLVLKMVNAKEYILKSKLKYKSIVDYYRDTNEMFPPF